MTQSPAGWYPDPYGTPQLRWWDGSQWTDATHPLEAAQGAQVGAGARSGAAGGPAVDSSGPQTGAPSGPHTGPQAGQQPAGAAATPDDAAASAAGSAPAATGGTTVADAAGGTASPASAAPEEQAARAQDADPTAATAQWASPSGPSPSGPSPAGPGGGGPWTGPGAMPRPGDTARLPAPGFPPPEPPRQTRPMAPWIMGGVAAAVVIVLLVVGTIYLTGNRSGRSAEGGIASSPTASAEPSSPNVEPSPSGPPSSGPSGFPEPSDGRITDPISGLSYSFPGAPWRIVDPSEVNSADPNSQQWTSGYQAISHENFEAGHDWLGNVLAGPLPAGAPYNGPQNLRDLVATFLINTESAFYSPPHERRILEDKAITVSGKRAWLLKFEMDFTEQSRINGWKWEKEVGALVMVDRGVNERPALLFATVPDNLDVGIVDQVIDSLEVR